MAGFEILKTKKIKEALFNVVSHLDKRTSLSFDSINKGEQYKSILVCEIDEQVVVVDGQKYFRSLKYLGFTEVMVYNFGEIKLSDYYMKRILLNVNQERLDYLGIAEIMSQELMLDISERLISMKTGLLLEDIEKYKNLLDFDWVDFQKQKINLQKDIFDEER